MQLDILYEKKVLIHVVGMSKDYLGNILILIL